MTNLCLSEGCVNVNDYASFYRRWILKIAEGNFPKFSLNSGPPLEQYSASVSGYEYGSVWKAVIALQLQVYNVMDEYCVSVDSVQCTLASVQATGDTELLSSLQSRLRRSELHPSAGSCVLLQHSSSHTEPGPGQRGDNVKSYL